MEASIKNPSNPDADVYSILEDLENYKNSDRKFHFLLCYPELPPNYCNEWYQTSNPFKYSVVQGYAPVSIAFNKNCQSLSDLATSLGLSVPDNYGSYEGQFGGLAKLGNDDAGMMGVKYRGSYSQDECYLLGAKTRYKGGLRGPSIKAVNIVELFVKI